MNVGFVRGGRRGFDPPPPGGEDSPLPPGRGSSPGTPWNQKNVFPGSSRRRTHVFTTPFVNLVGKELSENAIPGPLEGPGFFFGFVLFFTHGGNPPPPAGRGRGGYGTPCPQRFEEFNAEFGKVHATPSARTERYRHFHRTRRYIAAFNRQQRSYWLGLNHMGDWSPEERAALRGTAGVVAGRARIGPRQCLTDILPRKISVLFRRIFDFV